MNTQSYLAAVPTPVLVASVALAALVIAVVAAFLLPALKLVPAARYPESDISLRPPKLPARFRAVFESDRRLAYLWSEYEKSPHAQREERDGQMVVRGSRHRARLSCISTVRWWSTAACARSFLSMFRAFSPASVLSVPFSGLIEGPGAFQVSENAATVRNRLSR